LRSNDLLGNSTRQLWEKVVPMIREARERFDPRLYENFEYLYDEVTRRAVPVQSVLGVGSPFSMSGVGQSSTGQGE